jgi:hypothetical protein
MGRLRRGRGLRPEWVDLPRGARGSAPEGGCGPRDLGAVAPGWWRERCLQRADGDIGVPGGVGDLVDFTDLIDGGGGGG